MSPLGGVHITAGGMESYVGRPHKILFPLTLFAKATTYKLHELTTQHVILIYIINSKLETEKSILRHKSLCFRERGGLPVTSKLNS